MKKRFVLGVLVVTSFLAFGFIAHEIATGLKVSEQTSLVEQSSKKDLSTAPRYSYGEILSTLGIITVGGLALTLRETKSIKLESFRRDLNEKRSFIN
ncbi:hypothetical protein [Liquorilactobacillus sicerae]|uniref:hypothetical protein n=1 Tax=Liquorilactobacillus sicerae TaxID=1416943 RepID=UPI0024806D49|nr:hypothetical protein [Liquorilactobacillus sicerae]